jgi:hypothetical protein
MGPWKSVRGGRDGPRSGRAAAVTRPAVVHSSVIARRQPATAMRGIALGFVWFRIRARVHSAVRPARVRLHSRCKRLRPQSSRCNLRPRSSSPAPAQSARSLLMTILRSGGNRSVSLHDHRNFRQPWTPRCNCPDARRHARMEGLHGECSRTRSKRRVQRRARKEVRP